MEGADPCGGGVSETEDRVSTIPGRAESDPDLELARSRLN